MFKAKRKIFPRHKRERIFLRDNFTCQLCGKDLLHDKADRVIDHRVPLCKGGKNDDWNLWLLCDACDKRKQEKLRVDCTENYIENRIEQLKRTTKRK